MPDAPSAGGGGGAGVLPAPAPCTPEEFDAFWAKVEGLELQDVLQCIGDDLSGAGGCLTLNVIGAYTGLNNPVHLHTCIVATVKSVQVYLNPATANGVGPSGSTKTYPSLNRYHGTRTTVQHGRRISP
jgi:hypothetical protein